MKRASPGAITGATNPFREIMAMNTVMVCPLSLVDPGYPQSRKVYTDRTPWEEAIGRTMMTPIIIIHDIVDARGVTIMMIHAHPAVSVKQSIAASPQAPQIFLRTSDGSLGSYSYSPSPTRSKSRRRERSEQRIAQAMKAALTAGAVEAFRVRKEPGEWTGDKGKRILTAALTAGGTDGLVDRDPNKHSKRHIIESTLAGLAANHFVNGPRSRSRSKSRGREKSRSRVPDLAAAGALAAAGKEAYNRFKSRSRSRPRGRSHSRDSQEDSPRRERRRSKSISDYINRGMEALGLENKDKDKDDRRRPRDRPSRRDDYSGYDSDSDYGSKHHGSSRRTRHSRDVGRSLHLGSSYESPSSARSGAIGKEGHAYYQDRENHSSNSDKDSDLGSSTDEEHRHKKLKRKTLLATGLATVATIHAAHGLHGSMEKHKKRVKMVKEGDMTAKEARKLRLKNNLTDAASVGLATLGIKGAVDEWRHVDHMRKERHNFRKECDSRRERRHSRAQSQGSLPYRRTVYPDEIEECHISDNGSRRAMSVAQEV
ncbi:hypothetical protein ETB97_000967 [Aspergillus alliaceus]|uniref:Uncharacterized protein n=1 Tax=Petromyces alliaceus TaxID=209559 RepID=A0A8H6A2Z1_PETAA|nr:hypothetical protein ETB97_000967 [Aspergillus burnettii]